MNYQTFQTARDLCKAEKARIDQLWRNDPNYDDYRLEIEVTDDDINIFPAKDKDLHYASKFFDIASLLNASIYIGTFHRNDGAVVPRICIF